MPEPILIKLGMCIMAPEPSWTAYFINLLISLCVCMCIPPIAARQRFGRHVPMAINTRNKGRFVGDVVFCTVRVVSQESLWVCLCIPLSLLGNDSVNMFLRQRRIVEGVGFCAAHVVSNESRQLVLIRSYCGSGSNPISHV
jgi:hypothetical protein